MSIFIMRSGRRVPERETDQPGSDMLVRTVSHNADGTSRERATVAVSPDLFGGDTDRAQNYAQDLDARGYLPPADPMTYPEWTRLTAEHRIGERSAAIIWDICGRGVPLTLAIQRAGASSAARRRLQRLIKDIGWG